jgi:hypothetical protein
VASIYRFVKIGRFLQLIEEKALMFVLPDLWRDDHEGYLFRAVRLQDKVGEVLQAIYKIAPNSDGLEIALLTGFNKARYGQCWSRCPENAKLWAGCQIRIEADRDDVSKLDGIRAHDIRYVDSVNIEDEVRALFSYPDEKTTGWMSERVLLVKRKEYQYEEEVRLLTEIVEENVVNRPPDRLIPAMVEVFRRQCEEGKITKEQFQQEVNKVVISPIRRVSVAHVPNFIRSIMLEPSAKSEVDAKMARFCTEHSLNYLGRSGMYDFKV